MSKKLMKTLGVCILAVGLVTLIGKWVYVDFFSGEQVGKYTVQKFDGTVISLPGFSFSSGSPLATHQVGPLDLGPEMNPLRFIFHLKQKKTSSMSSRTSCDFSLVDQNGNEVWKHSGSQGGSSSDSGSSSGTNSSSISLGSFNIETPGKYMLLSNIEQKGLDAPLILSAEVSLRKNVAEGNPKFYLIAGAIAIIGFVLMLLGKEK